MAIIVGTRTNALTDSTNQAINIDPILRYKQEYQTPMNQFFIFNKTASLVTDEAKGKFQSREKSPISRVNEIATVPAGGTTGDTTATITLVDTSAYKGFRLGDTFIIEATGDTAVVTAHPSSNSITIRKVGSGNWSVALATSQIIRQLSSAVKENYARQVSVTNEGSNVYGYTQIGLDAVGISGREWGTKRYVDKDGSFKGLIEEKADEITKYEERKFLLNDVAYYDATNNISYSAGCRGTLTTNLKYFTGDLDETEIDDICKQVFAKNDTTVLYAYCGAEYLDQVNKILKQNFTFNTQDIIKAYGGLSKQGGNPQVGRYFTPYGMVYFIWEPMLEGDVFGNMAFYLNPKHMRRRYFKDDYDGTRKFRIEPDVQDPGTGERIDQMIWDTGLEITPESYHGVHKQA